MKSDVSTKVYSAWGIELNQANVNKYVKAVIINFGDERGDIIVENDNFGTRRKYADFTNGKKKAIYREAILAVKSVLHSAKPIDAVPVVRCKDCKYCDISLVLPTGRKMYNCMEGSHDHQTLLKPNDFCSRGETRKYISCNISRLMRSGR